MDDDDNVIQLEDLRAQRKDSGLVKCENCEDISNEETPGFAPCDDPEEMVGMLPAEEYPIVLLTDPEDKLGVSMKPDGARALVDALLDAIDQVERARG